MSGVTASAGVTKDGPTFPALLKPFLPSHFSSVTDNQAIAKPAEYIGSFMVAGKGHHDRAEIVRQKLESARKYTQSRPIVLLISLNGIKVCRDDDQHVYMAHALRRISYATCDPENFQFAFLAREPKSEPNVQYCHAFVTNTAEEAEELNNIVGEAFRMAYAQQQMALLSRQLQHTSISPQPAPCQSATFAPLASTGHDPSQPCPVPNGVLVPAPETESVSQISPLRCGGTVTPTINTNQSGVPQKPLPAIPTTQPVAMPPEPAPLTNPSTHATEYTPRGHKLHKHHKHHKHRHRHKARDAAAQTSGTLLDACSIDSGRHTGTSESVGGLLTDCSAVLLDTTTVPPADLPRTQPPPPPPPRVSSSLTPFKLEPTCNPQSSVVLPRVHTPVTLESVGTTAQPNFRLSSIVASDDVVPSSHLNDVLIEKESAQISLQSFVMELADRNIARPSPQISRPQSPHSYDMADHRECCLLPESDTGVTALTSHSPGTPLAVICPTKTTSSSTTGCSTATSESTHSGSHSGSSLPCSRHSEPHGSAIGAESQSCGRSGSYPSSMAQARSPTKTHNQNLQRRESRDSVHSSGSQRHSHIPDTPGAPFVDEPFDITHAPWYQPLVPREVALELLSRQPPGSFVIRDSGSHANCYALSVRYGEGAGRCGGIPSGKQVVQQQQRLSACSQSGSCYPFPTTGISHYLIQRTPRGGVKLKGLDKEWPSLACLVLHLTVMPEMLPCPLKLPKAAANPMFTPVDATPESHLQGRCDQTHPVSDAPRPCCEPGCIPTTLGLEDEDYQRLSDFSSIMADLRMRPRTVARNGAAHRKAR